jgi:membrane protease YdiL (CAAX protease family)
MGIVQCFGEEFAWRGYLLPKLIEKFSVQKAVIINGVIWGIWHSPIIAMGYNYGDEHPVFGIIAMIIFCVVLGIIESFLFYKTQSIWCSVIFHAAINGMDTWSPSALFMSKTPNMFVGPNLLGIIGGIGFVIVAVILFMKLKNEKNCSIKNNPSVTNRLY